MGKYFVCAYFAEGAGAAMVDLLAGQVHLMLDRLSASGPQIKSLE